MKMMNYLLKAIEEINTEELKNTISNNDAS